MNRSALRPVGLALALQLGCAHAGPAAPGSDESAPSVVFEVEGGFAGRMQRLEVGARGELTLWERGVETGNGTLDEATLGRLHSIVDSEAFRTLGPRYLPARTCCDLYSYRVHVARDDGEQSVATLDGAEWPPALGEAIALLSEARQQVSAPLQ